MLTFNEFSPKRVGGSLVLAGVVHVIFLIVYRLYFHPFAKYPGPLLAKLTDWYSAYHNYMKDVHIDMLRCHEKYGDFVRYGPNKIIVNSVTGFQDIYSHGKNVTKSTAYLTIGGKATLDTHSVLSSSDKKEHRRKRKAIASGFTDAAVRIYEPVIQSQINILCERLIDHDKSNNTTREDAQKWASPKDMAIWSNYFSFDVMTNVIFSLQMDLMNKPEFRSIVDTIDTLMHRVGVLSQIPHMITWGLGGLVLPQGKKALDTFLTRAATIAVNRAQSSSSEDFRDAFQNVLDAKDPDTGKHLEISELAVETGVLVVAGSDTVSSALSAILFYLSRNPNSYANLTNEIRTTFPDSRDIHSGPELRSCTYLHACIDEGLRISSPVIAAPWRVVEKGGADIDGEHVPEGYVVGTSLYALHHNPVPFPHPFRFSPERWLPSQSNSQEAIEAARKAFAPFLIGSRMCAAKNMAMMELLLTVARIVWSMDFKIAEGKEGLIGQGGLRMGSGRERDDEFQLYSHFVTVAKKGPVLQFRKRQ